MTNLVQFPGLGLSFELDRVAFSIGGMNIYWYGVCIAVGMCLALVFAFRHSVEFGVDADAMVDVILIGVVMGILCARLYYVALSPYQYHSLKDVLAIRDGGLAIYGGIIGAFLFGGLACKWRKVPMLPMFDLAAMGFLIGQGCGRWGNFFNREAHGGVTTCFLRMGLVENGALQYFHPTFLYESVWNLTGFVVLHFLSKKRKFDGQMFLAYLAWYGAGRMVIEGLRTDSLWLGPVRVSQLLAAVTMLLSLGILLYQAIFVRHDPAKMQVNRVAAAEAAKAAEAQPEETAEPEDAASEPEDEVSEETESSEESKE